MRVHGLRATGMTMADPDHAFPPPSISQGHEPFRQAFDLYEANGADFHASLAHCFAFGEVQSNADFFCMGWPTQEGFWVQCLAGDMRACLRFNRGRFPKIIFNRVFRGQPQIRSIEHSTLERHGISKHASPAD